MTDNLTIDTLNEAVLRLSHLPPPLVGIVCRPDVVGRMVALIREETAEVIDPLLRTLCQVPVYRKDDQEEPYRLFFDHAELRAYLKP